MQVWISLWLQLNLKLRAHRIKRTKSKSFASTTTEEKQQLHNKIRKSVLLFWGYRVKRITAIVMSKVALYFRRWKNYTRQKSKCLCCCCCCMLGTQSGNQSFIARASNFWAHHFRISFAFEKCDYYAIYQLFLVAWHTYITIQIVFYTITRHDAVKEQVFYHPPKMFVQSSSLLVQNQMEIITFTGYK